MQVLSPRCAGLDIHQKTVVACVVLTVPDGTVQQYTQTFLTMTAGLLALADWLGPMESRMSRSKVAAYTGILFSICLRSTTRSFWSTPTI